MIAVNNKTDDFGGRFRFIFFGKTIRPIDKTRLFL